MSVGQGRGSKPERIARLLSVSRGRRQELSGCGGSLSFWWLTAWSPARLGGSSLGGEQVPPTPNSQHIVGGGGQSGGQAMAPRKSAAEFEN